MMHYHRHCSFYILVLVFTLVVAPTRAWLPPTKIRGVNLGSLFVVEPWMAAKAWQKIGCAGYASEWDCVVALGQHKADEAFTSHWNSWITYDDLEKMKCYGLNTIRIPVGYWIKEDLVRMNEHFPRGAMKYLERLCGWASDLGLYIIIDLHGAPGAQVAHNAFTGQIAAEPGFYNETEYKRAVSFLAWMTNRIHTCPAYRNVGMLEFVNEPTRNKTLASTMISSYYPKGYAMMNPLWGHGNPTQDLKDPSSIAYDDHRYIKWDSSVAVTQSAYIHNACTSDRSSNESIPTIVGEWSISVPDNVERTPAWDPNTQREFYTDFFAALTTTWEAQTSGWIFWSWKAQLDDYRWSYVDGVAAGVIPSNLNDLNVTICDGKRRL